MSLGQNAAARLHTERAALGAGVGFVAFLAAQPGGDSFATVVDNLVQLAVATLAAAAGASVARRESGRLRRSWVFIALACAAWAAGQAVWIGYEVLTDTPVPQPSAADVGFLLAIPLLLAGIVTYPAAGLVTMGRLRLALDAMAIALGLIFAFHGTFLGTTLDVAGPWSLARGVAVAYPVADVIALAIAIPMLLRRRDVRRGPLPLLTLGILGLTVSDISFAYLTAENNPLGNGPENAGWAIGFGLIGLAALRVGTEPSSNITSEHPLSRGENLIPAIPVVLAGAVLLSRASLGEEINAFLAVTGAVLLFVLALRQLAIQLENAELTRSLRLTVDQLQAREDELRHRAFHDPLTGLANRDLFRHRLETALERHPLASVAVAFIDLDDFKTVNDSLGHDAGDELLRLVAERIGTCIRPGDTVARLGGDEFAVLIDDSSGADPLAQRVLDAFELPFALGSRELQVATSVGIATGVGATHGVKDLLQDADLAMYAAKSAGKGRAESFHQSMRQAVLARLDLLHDLDAALLGGELFLEYQPVLRLSSDTVAGYEALLRWNHPSRGVLAPSAFLELAEESGRIVAIGWWTLEEAFRAQQRFPVEGEGPPPWISVNLSARQLLAPNAPLALGHALRASSIDPGRVVLELTEGALLSGAGVTERLAELKRVGVRLAVDDFGIGYSSLSYLARLPFDIVKIDRSFVERIGRDRSDEVFIAAIVQLAESLGIKTIAEGVEHDWQLDRIRELGCDAAQGFLIGRPMAQPALWGNHDP